MFRWRRASFDLPPGRSERSWQGSPAIRGRLLGIGGHLHRYAEVLRFEDLTDPRVIWEGRPRVDSSGRVLQVPAGHLWKRGGAPLEPDHTYRLTAVYHNPTSDTIRAGGMGAMGGVFLPQRDERWPRVDRTHPQYVADLLLLRNRPGHSAFLDAGLLRSRPVHRH